MANARWIPGNHGPSGPVYNYAGLKITASMPDLPSRVAHIKTAIKQLLP